MKFNNLIPVILSRAVEQELSDSNEQLSEAVVTNQSIIAAKRKMEQEMSTLQVSLSISQLSSSGQGPGEVQEGQSQVRFFKNLKSCPG